MTDNDQRKRENRKTILLLIALILLAACLLILGIWQGLKKPALSKTQESPELGQAVGTLVNGQDLFMRSENGDISIDISQCATQVNGKIIMTPMGEYVNDLATPDSVWTRPSTVDVSYFDNGKSSFEHFSTLCAIRVCFTLTADQWIHYKATPTDFSLQYLRSDNTSTPFWVFLPVQVKPETQELCADYNKLGLYALAVKSLPSPLTGGLYAPVQENPTPTQSGIYVP